MALNSGLWLPREKPDYPELDPFDPINRGRVCALVMGEGRGKTAWDASPYKNHGTLNQTGYSWAKSHHGGQALQFNGSTEYVVINEAAAPLLDITGSEISLGTWFYPTGTADYQGLVLKSAGGNRQYALYLQTGNVNQVFIALSGTTLGAGGTNVALSSPWVLNAFNRIDFAYRDGVGLNIYLNRKKVFFSAYSGSITHQVANISFGAQSIDNSLHLTGRQDGADIWQRCISYEEHCRLWDEGWAGVLQNDTTDYRITVVGGSNGVGSSAGVGAASGVGAELATSVGSSAGVATVPGVGAELATSVASSTCAATAPGVGAAIANSVGSSMGAATAPGVGTFTGGGSAGAAAGTATASGVGNSIANSAGTASGASTAFAISTNPYWLQNIAPLPVWGAVAPPSSAWSANAPAAPAWTKQFP